MVECEFSVRVFLFVPASVLIDTWWNVNKDHIAYTIPVYPVLIDTWWNVNKDHIAYTIPVYPVLIDTWWNVNYIREHSQFGA